MKHNTLPPSKVSPPTPAVGSTLTGTGSNQLGVRQYNERLILQLIRQAGELPKADIARATHLSPQTVSVIINSLLDDGLLVKQERRKEGRIGQPSVPIALATHGAYALGIKIGRGSLDVILMGFTGQVLDRRHHTYAYPDSQEVLAKIESFVGELLHSFTQEQRQRLVGAGVAVPYNLDGWAEELQLPEQALATWREINLQAALKTRLEMPVIVTNDATAACIAELVFGNTPQFESYLYFFIGVFVGGGVVLDGRLYQGSSGNAGAVGSMPMAGFEGHRQDQLISYASRFHLERNLNQAGFSLNDDLDANQEAQAIIEAWRQKAAQALAYAITSAMAVFDFQGVIVDGSLPETIAEPLLQDIEACLKQMNFQGLTKPHICAGTIGDEARALGGALPPIYENFAPGLDVLMKV